MMTNGELFNMLEVYAAEYAPKAIESITRNCHMNNYRGEQVSRNTIDALIVDFINFIAYKKGGDLGLYTKDLYSNTNSLQKEIGQ